MIHARLKPPGRTTTLTRGQFRGVSEAKLLELVTRLGRDVKIVVGPVCSRLRLGPPTTRPALRRHEAPRPRAPFNLEARRRAGFTVEELDALSGGQA